MSSQLNIEERLYKCFEEVFREYDGQLSVSIQESEIVYDESGFACASEFLSEMYEKYRKENPKIPTIRKKREDECEINESDIIKIVITVLRYNLMLVKFYKNDYDFISFTCDEMELKHSDMSEIEILREWIKSNKAIQWL